VRRQCSSANNANTGGADIPQCPNFDSASEHVCVTAALISSPSRSAEMYPSLSGREERISSTVDGEKHKILFGSAGIDRAPPLNRVVENEGGWPPLTAGGGGDAGPPAPKSAEGERREEFSKIGARFPAMPVPPDKFNTDFLSEDTGETKETEEHEPEGEEIL
jgi:hypothetical protein